MLAARPPMHKGRASHSCLPQVPFLTPFPPPHRASEAGSLSGRCPDSRSGRLPQAEWQGDSSPLWPVSAALFWGRLEVREPFLRPSSFADKATWLLAAPRPSPADPQDWAPGPLAQPPWPCVLPWESWLGGARPCGKAGSLLAPRWSPPGRGLSWPACLRHHTARTPSPPGRSVSFGSLPSTFS